MPRTPRATTGAAPATPRTRVAKPRLETLPSGIRMVGPNDDSTVHGAVDLGYLRRLVTTVGRKYPDTSIVEFADERGGYTEVSPA